MTKLSPIAKEPMAIHGARRRNGPGAASPAGRPRTEDDRLNGFLNRLHPDIKVTPGRYKKGYDHVPGLRVEVDGAAANFDFPFSPGRYSDADFGSRAWGWELAQHLLRFDQAYRAGKIAEYLVEGNTGAFQHDGEKVMAAVRAKYVNAKTGAGIPRP
jgi:hypothetical protein